jgi:hypothetical protein
LKQLALHPNKNSKRPRGHTKSLSQTKKLTTDTSKKGLKNQTGGGGGAHFSDTQTIKETHQKKKKKKTKLQ